MEFFNKAQAVRLGSHHGKYLVANDDEETICQSRNGSSPEARWTVEFVEGSNHLIRLKSHYSKYLTASDELFLLGVQGEKILQTTPTLAKDSSIEWEPITAGFHVKLRTRRGNFLRANGGTPPWRNSVTHGVPHRTTTQDWVLWVVDVVNILDFHSLSKSNSFASSLSSCPSSYSEDFTSSENDSMEPLELSASNFGHLFKRECAMEIFQKAKVVRLRSHHDKYLLAEEDEESVCQDRNGSCMSARWIVEIVQDTNFLRFKSCYGKYLTASNIPLFLGLTGKKVLQTLPRRLDSSLEWEPIKEGIQVKFKTRYGHYLRANGGVPPWRNSITHDIPHRSATQDWILWDVDIVEFQKNAPSAPPPVKIVEKAPPAPKPVKVARQTPSEPGSPTQISLKSPRNEVGNSFPRSPVRDEGRLIVYEVVDDSNVDESKRELSFTFKRSGVEQLRKALKEETGLDDILVCSRNPLNGKLYPLRLQLPPNNATMNVVVVPSTSKVARDLK